MKKSNGFLLQDALFALFVLIVCIGLLCGAVFTFYQQKDVSIYEKIERKWFYHD